MTVVRVHHVQITIPEGAEAEGRQFYCQLLGLPEVEKPASLRGRGGFWLQLGELKIHVGTEDGVDRSVTKGHLAYEVTDLAAWRARLHEAGVPIGDSVPIPGHVRFEARDPFGNRVEFLQAVEATHHDQTDQRPEAESNPGHQAVPVERPMGV
jgi:catechol 2,3-dioxygenase-like lactoylglutathione lyase family enzyme